MTQFVISDHHFYHENIIEDCERPFSSVDEMNTEMRDRWRNVVSEDDVVYYGGDVAMADGETAIDVIESLPGSVLYILGNHDEDIDPEDAPFPVVEHAILQHDGYRFFYTHRPENVPDEWTEWVLHGHHHNNFPIEHPFIHYDKHQVHVSAELIEYTPISLASITSILDELSNGDKVRTIDDVDSEYVSD